MGDDGPGEVGFLGHPSGLAVASAAAALPAHVALVHCWHVDQAEDGRTVFEQGDQGGEERDAAGEADGSVDRVDQPAGSIGRALAPELLSEDGEVRESLPQDLSDGLLCRPIGLRDRRAVGLGLDGDGPEARKDLLAGPVARSTGGRGDGFEVERRHGGSG